MPLGNLFVLNSDQELNYTGEELRPHFLLKKFDVRGSGLIAAQGSCHVETHHLVDYEDQLAKDWIGAKRMVHFLGEWFGCSLSEGVLLQRIMVSNLQQVLQEQVGEFVMRQGDDLFWKERKLTVSIVTASPVSVLFHLGLNIDAAGAPAHVKAAGLQDLGVADPKSLSDEVLNRFKAEWESIDWACSKVRPVI